MMMMMMRGLTRQLAILNVCMSGLYFSIYTAHGIWKFVVGVVEFNELYGI